MNTARPISDDRQVIREISKMECALVEALCVDDKWLKLNEESILRWALSLARVSRVALAGEQKGKEVVIGHATDPYRQTLFDMLHPCVKGDSVVNKNEIVGLIPKISALCKSERKDLLALFGSRLPQADLDEAVRKRPLALALGGGGGTAYVYLGAFEVLQSAGILPSAIAATSMGAILGAYRARYKDFSLEHLKRVMEPISFDKIARPFEANSKYSVPSTFRLHLRDAFGRQFSQNGDPLRLRELEVPFRVSVAGVAHIEGERDDEMAQFAHLLEATAHDVMQLRQEEKSLTAKLLELAKKPLKAIYLGGDELTREFDVIDAVGFSAAVPGIFHYDIQPGDVRMMELLTTTMKRNGVYRLVDGGLADNLPSQEALNAVQEQNLETGRDPFVLALDGFAPNFHRHWLFLPLMQIAAQNSRRGKEVAHRTITYKHVLSPLNVVPSKEELLRALHNGIEETKPHLAFIRKMVGSIDMPDFMKA